MHVIFLAPHFPANQRRFVQGLKNVGARVTGIGDVPVGAIGEGLRSLLDGYEEVLLGALSGERSSVCLSFGRAIKTGTGWPPNQEVYDKCKQIYDGDSE